MGRIFLLESGIFQCVYLPLALEVDNGLFIDCLGCVAVNKIKKQLLGLYQLNIIIHPSFLPSPFGFGQNEGRSEYILISSPTTDVPYQKILLYTAFWCFC